MSEDQTTQQDAADQDWDPDEHWELLKKRGLVKGERPRKEDRVDPSTMRPIRYHGTNDDLLRDLGRCR